MITRIYKQGPCTWTMMMFLYNNHTVSLLGLGVEQGPWTMNHVYSYHDNHVNTAGATPVMKTIIRRRTV